MKRKKKNFIDASCQTDHFTDNYLCCICMVREKCIIFEPCKHLSVCQECLQKYQKKVCPICQQKSFATTKIFVT